MMRMREFCFGSIVFVMAVIVCKFVCQMRKRVNRLEQYCEQYRQH